MLLRCVTLEDGRKMLLDIHDGICGQHAAPRDLVGKVFRHGFYWPTAIANIWDLTKTCKGCQYYTKQSHLPAQVVQMVPVTWPF